MRYHGYTIEPQYLPGDNFRVLADGRVVDKQPRQIDFYTVTCNDTGWRHANCASYAEAKAMIDDTNKLLGVLS